MKYYVTTLSIYFAFFCGAGLLLCGPLAALFHGGSRRLDTPGRKKNGYAGKLFAASFSSEWRAELFIGGCVFIFLAALLAGMRIFRPYPAFVLSVLLALCPLVFLALRLEVSRNRASREGISLVTELYRQYRMNGLNIYEAMEAAVVSDGDYPTCRAHLYRLLLRLRESPGILETRRSLDQFAFAIGTTWGKILAVNIRTAVEKGSDISNALTDIAIQLKAAVSRSEDRKRLNSESVRMTLFLVPALYAGTCFAATRYLRVDARVFFRNQFTTREGLTFFVIIALLFVFNVVILTLAGNRRLDY
ncbi:MAG: hypothetical protein II689_04320 [Firmicutes bacterium]|nr:hypothetical protein [Bacillota bacterium]